MTTRRSRSTRIGRPFEPRYVKAETLRDGDLIRVTFTEGDVKYSRTGRINSRANEGGDRVLYSAEGYELLKWRPGQPQPRITLLDSIEANTSVPLSGMDELNERLK